METAAEHDFCFPHLLNASCKRLAQPYAITALVQAAMFCISLLTTTLNLLVIISVSHYKQLHSPTNLLLLSLAVSDFSVGLVMFLVSQFVDGCWRFGDAVCLLYMCLSFSVTYSSVVTIVLISIDRYIAICHPLHYVKVTVQRVRGCICLSWLFSVGYSLLLLKDNLHSGGGSGSCVGECVSVIGYLAGIVDVFVSFLVPVCAVALLYARVFVVVIIQVRSMRVQIVAMNSQRRGGGVNKPELRAASTLAVITVVFLICLCPYYFLMLVGQDSGLSAAKIVAVLYLFYFNSCLNPILYTFLYSWFRKCLRHIVTLQILQPGSSQTRILAADAQ